MKLRATIFAFAIFCFLASSPAWAAASICDTVPGNVIVNCGFETGDFTGWTNTLNTGFTGVTNNPRYVNSGNFGAQLGPVGSDGSLSQSFWGNTLTFVYRQDPAYWGLDDVIAVDGGHIVPGTDLWYLSFYLENDGGTPNDFTVFWNGVDIGPDIVNADGSPFTSYLVVVEGYPTPEPGTLVLLGSGILGLAGVIRRKLSL